LSFNCLFVVSLSLLLRKKRNNNGKRMMKRGVRKRIELLFKDK